MRFWRHNKLDQEFEQDPGEVVGEFVQAVRDGYEIPQRGMEFGIKWWMSDAKAFDSTWEEEDYEREMVPAMQRWADEHPDDRDFMLEKVYGPAYI